MPGSSLIASSAYQKWPKRTVNRPVALSREREREKEKRRREKRGGERSRPGQREKKRKERDGSGCKHVPAPTEGVEVLRARTQRRAEGRPEPTPREEGGRRKREARRRERRDPTKTSNGNPKTPDTQKPCGILSTKERKQCTQTTDATPRKRTNTKSEFGPQNPPSPRTRP